MESKPALKQLEEAIAEEFGWAANVANQAIINAAVAGKAQRLGMSPQDYCEFAATSQSELLALVEETAIGATGFFNAPHQFDVLRQRLLPELLNACPTERQLRLWSAACATGEEAYSLAIAVNQVQPQAKDQHVEVFATDVRNRALLAASRARYPLATLQGVDGNTLAQFFERLPDTEDSAEAVESYVVAASVRRLVVFRRLNLFDRIYWRDVAGRFDLIFCSNMLSMLSGMAARQLVTNLSGALRTGGYLLVAPAEAQLVHSNKLTPLADEPSCFQKN